MDDMHTKGRIECLPRGSRSRHRPPSTPIVSTSHFLQKHNSREAVRNQRLGVTQFSRGVLAPKYFVHSKVLVFFSLVRPCHIKANRATFAKQSLTPFFHDWPIADPDFSGHACGFGIHHQTQPKGDDDIVFANDVLSIFRRIRFVKGLNLVERWHTISQTELFSSIGDSVRVPFQICRLHRFMLWLRRFGLQWRRHTLRVSRTGLSARSDRRLLRFANLFGKDHGFLGELDGKPSVWMFAEPGNPAGRPRSRAPMRPLLFLCQVSATTACTLTRKFAANLLVGIMNSEGFGLVTFHRIAFDVVFPPFLAWHGSAFVCSPTLQTV